MISSIIKFIRDIILKFSLITGLNTIFGYFNRRSVVILWYHGICDDNFTLLSDYDERHIPTSVFNKQLLYLKNHGYTFINMTDLIDILHNTKNKPKRLACLTFDDGYENVIKNAYPLMVKYGARGCLYIIPSLIETRDPLWTDLIDIVLWKNTESHFKFLFDQEINYPTNSRMEIAAAIIDIKKKLRSVSNERRLELLKQFRITNPEDIPEDFLISNWNQLKNLNQDILEIGSHSLTHPNLDKLSKQNEFQQEINLSKYMIEKKLHHKVDHFCYPAGAFNNSLKSMVKEAGYTTGVSIIPGLNNNNDKTDFFELRRISIKSDMTYFKTAITGFYAAIFKLYTLFGL
jgi:peptidoglycan/xylan/chitin deacetylase (PgdA/CDA1 family)